jgi:hypothetical protein
VCLCRYPTDRIPPHTSSKSRRRVRRALTRAYVSMASSYAIRHGQLECRHTSCVASSRLLAQDSSSAAMCPVTPAPESRLEADRVMPHGSWHQLLPPSIGQLWSRHESSGSGSRLLTQDSSGAVMCPMELYGLWAIEINKYPLVTLSS